MVSNNTKLILSIVALSVIMAVTGGKVFADGNCVTQYGGSQYGTNCNPNDLVINKEVQKIGVQSLDGSPVYIENLSVSDTLPVPGNFMTFRLTVKNNSGQTFDPVTVKDVFPPYLSYVSGGPSGTVYDPATRTMTVTLNNLIAGETRQLVIVAKVADASAFPTGQSTFCVVNTAQVSSLNRFDQDTAQICLNAKGTAKATLPKAGVNDLLMVVPFALIGLAGMGLATKKI
jgi:uncharacterized repeat protein (TIGR01451 family)